MPALSTNITAADEQFDLLVIGGGAAGMTAALAAAIDGFRPLLCETSAFVGGTAARSSGGIWIPGNSHTARAGKPDSVADAEAYIAAFFRNAQPNKARDTYVKKGREVVDWLEDNSELRFEPMATHPDYRPFAGASMGGRPLGTKAFDGRLLGSDFNLVAPPLPSLVALGGMMVGRADIPHFLQPFGSLKSFLHVTCAVGRYFRDRLSYRRGTNLLMGNALVARLLYSLKARNVPIWTQTNVVELLRDGDRVTGAAVERNGKRVRIDAAAGVIVATGGFSHGAKWRQKLMSAAEAKTLSLVCETNQGDGLTLAQTAGAQVGRGSLSSSSVWTPISLLQRRDGTAIQYPHLFLDRPKPGFIAVSRSGRRFVNEAQSYHDFVAGMLASDDVMSHLPAFLICDKTALERYGLGLVLPGRRSLGKYLDAGYLTLGDTIDELAVKLGINTAQLQATIVRNNAFAKIGIDEDFNKGGSSFNRAHGDPAQPGNPCLGTISTPPYAAVAIWPADLSTVAGIACDENGQAIDSAGQPIAGLHVCGNDMTSIFEGEAPGPGSTLGPAVVFGVLAARHALSVGSSTKKRLAPA